jgi:hypothetical protein
MNENWQQEGERVLKEASFWKKKKKKEKKKEKEIVKL